MGIVGKVESCESTCIFNQWSILICRLTDWDHAVDSAIRRSNQCKALRECLWYHVLGRRSLASSTLVMTWQPLDLKVGPSGRASTTSSVKTVVWLDVMHVCPGRCV
jgi:flavin-binding protein dodecin